MGALLELKDATVTFGGVAALDRVNLAVEEGELVGLIGPNGSGKSTLLNLVSGQVRAARGEIWYAGRPVHHLPPHQRARLGIGHAFQQVSVFPAMTVAGNLRLAVQSRNGFRWQMWTAAERYPAVNEEVARLLADFALEGRADHPAGSLPHGEKRVLDVALALAIRPRLLLLDEPTAGMALEDVPRIAELIRRLHRQHGMTILVVEHRIDMVKALVDRIAVLHDGRLLASGTPGEIMADGRVQQVYLGGLYERHG